MPIMPVSMPKAVKALFRSLVSLTWRALSRAVLVLSFLPSNAPRPPRPANAFMPDSMSRPGTDLLSSA
ncbi:hypothetical protein D3C80_1869330 [compost metagenome]